MKKSMLVWGIIIAVVLIIGILLAVFLGKVLTPAGPGTNLNNNLIGGCAGVSLEYLQECCDNWAEENNIFHINCVGRWNIIDNQCSWVCGID